MAGDATSGDGAFLARLGETVLSHGFAVLPIRVGAKRPALGEGWQHTQADTAMVRRWVGNGLAKAGVGILAATAPGVDIDTLDLDAARHMEAWVRREIGEAPVRYGQRPKRLMIFRAIKPFPKVQSRQWLDAEGRKARLEVLCDGQQWVAFHVHPTTGKPYEWRGDRGPHTLDRTELIELDEAGARRVVAEFERYAEATPGWRLAPSAEVVPFPKRDEDPDDFLAGAPKAPLGLDPEQTRRLLDVIPVYEQYPDWLGIMACLSHEHGHEPAVALELAHHYSQRCGNYDGAEVDKKMESFRRDGAPGAKTARWLLRLAKDTQREAAAGARAEVEASLYGAGSLEALLRAADAAKRVPMEPAARNALAGILRERYRAVMSQPLSVRDSREMLRYEDPERRAMPGWLQGWTYLTDELAFYRPEDGTVLVERAFDAVHGRRMLTARELMEGRSHPETRPSDVALHRHQVPICRGRLFMPGEERIFTLNGVRYVNTYSERSVPAVPAVPSAQDRADVERVKAHFLHLFPIERDREILVSWLAYIVKHRRRPHWAVMLQGTEGDGKTWFRHLLAAVLGPENVRAIDGAILQTPFNGWAEGILALVVEEVLLRGHNRHDILNRIKPLITNAAVAIHRKGRDPYEIPNTAGVLLLTNHADALPLGDGDSRYFALRSQWQTQDALAAFRKANPDYYAELYAALERSAGAIRGWLLEHEPHPEFNPAARAPASAGRTYMAEITKSDERLDMETVLEGSIRPDVTRTLLSTAALADALAEHSGAMIPSTRSLNRMLSEMGFTFLGKWKIEGAWSRYWSREPGLFQPGTAATGHLIREYLRHGGI